MTEKIPWTNLGNLRVSAIFIAFLARAGPAFFQKKPGNTFWVLIFPVREAGLGTTDHRAVPDTDFFRGILLTSEGDPVESTRASPGRRPE